MKMGFKEKRLDLDIRRKNSVKTMGQPRRKLQPPWTSPTVLLVLCSLIPLSLAAVTTVEIEVTVPPLLEAQPPKGEVLFTVNHDPDQDPDPFTLPCKAKALPQPSYSWLKDGEPFSPEDAGDDDDGKGRVEMLDGEGSLVFHDPRPGDEGDYQCIAENKVGKVHSDVAMVRRAILGNFPKGDPRVVTATLGKPLGLPCTPPEGYPEPTVHWVLQNSDGSLRSLDSPRLTVDEEGTLWFSYITPEDASEDALYACAASSATRTEYRMGNWVYLNVSYPDDDDEATLPEAPVAPIKQHVSEPEVTTLAGEDVKLYCVYGGYPVPSVKWWRESRADVESDQLEYNGKVLALSDISEEDMGSYYCQASNEAGEGEVHHFTVYVEAAPHFVVEPELVNKPEGESATFHCEARGDPEPTITWTKDGEVMESHDTTIVFDTLSLDHKAVISCNASNTHGYVYKSVYLNVLSLPPEWMTEPEDVAVLEDSSAIVECEAFGSPDPEVTWFRVDDGEEVEIHDEDPRYDIKDNKLVIKSVNEHSDGHYVCKAENKFGSIEAGAEVSIRSRTSAEVSVIHERVEAGDHVSLDCKVRYDEALEPEITWLHDEKKIDLEDDNYNEGKRDKSDDDDDDDDDGREETTWVLEIMQVHGEDSGVYTCNVKTDLDSVSDDLILNVEDVPNPPKLKNVDCSGHEAYMEWASMGENNAPLQGYVIQYVTQFHPDDWKDAENQIPSSETTYSSRFRTMALVKMSPGMNYTFRVLAFNRVGMSNPSEDTYECASPGLPPDHHPHNVTVIPNAPGSLQISWDVMEQEEHNGPDFHYKVLWRPVDNDTSVDEDGNDDDDETTGEDGDVDEEEDDDMEDGWHFMIIEDWEESSVELENLPPYEEYEVKVEAHNIYGDSDEPVEVIQEHSGQDVPEEAPTELEALDADATEVVLTWEPVDEDSVHGLLLGYEIELWEADEDENDAQKIRSNGPVARAELTDLKPFTEYNARISAVNSAFSGPASSSVSFKTAEGESGPVTKFEVQQLGSRSLLVNWEAPEEPNGITRGYQVHYRLIEADGEEGPLLKYTADELTLDNTLIKLANLQEGGKYRVEVAAMNGAGAGDESSMDFQLQEIKPRRPATPVFSWSLVEDEEEDIKDKDGDGDVDEEDVRNQNVIIGDTNNDGEVNKDDVLDVDNDGDIDQDDFNVADIDNDGDVDEYDVKAADRDDDGDVDVSDIGDEDGDGDFDGADVIAADEDGDGDIDASDDDEEDTLLEDRDQDGDIDQDDVTDINRDGVIDIKDFNAADVDNDGDVDADDLHVADKDGDGDIDAADVADLDGDGRLDGDDLEVSDKDGDGDIDSEDFALRRVILTDVDGDGDIDNDDVIDTDNDGDIDEDDHAIADIDNDGDVDADDVKAADRDGDGDIDIADVGDEDGDGDFDGADVIAADEDGDGDIDASDDDEENVLLEDRDGDGDIDRHDVTDIDGDGDVDIHDFSAADVDDDGDVDMDDLKAADKDGDGDVDGADITDFDGDGKIDNEDLDLDDRDNDGDIDAKDYKFRNTLLADTDGDGDIDEDDVLDIDGDGDIDEADKKAADIDDDGDVDEEDVKQGDKDGDRDIDASDVSDVDGDGVIDEGDLDVKDRDGDGDVDATDFALRNVFLEDTDNDGDIDKDDVLDTDGDGDIDQDDFDVADINNDGDVDIHDIRAADRDHDGDIDANDIGDEDGDGDIDGSDVIAADEDGDGDIDANDDNGESIILADTDKDGIIDKNDVKDINGDGVIDQKDFDAADVDNDGDFDADDIRAADKDGDLDVDAADITDVNSDGIVDGRDLVASDKDGDGDIDRKDFRNLNVFLKDTDRDGDIDEDDVLDTDFDGDVDQDDINAADVDNDGDVDRDDVIAADIDGDGDIDFRDIGDEDGDGDIDGDDLEMADRDGDGDVDAADDGRGIDIKINWKPDFDKHPGVDFYVEKRVEGSTKWQKSPMERERLYQTLTGLDPRRDYEVRMVAKDGPYETPSKIIRIPASEGVKRHPSAEEFSHPELEGDFTAITECAEDAGSILYCSVHLTKSFSQTTTTPITTVTKTSKPTPSPLGDLILTPDYQNNEKSYRDKLPPFYSSLPEAAYLYHDEEEFAMNDSYNYEDLEYDYEYTDEDHYPTSLEGTLVYPDWSEDSWELASSEFGRGKFKQEYEGMVNEMSSDDYPHINEDNKTEPGTDTHHKDKEDITPNTEKFGDVNSIDHTLRDTFSDDLESDSYSDDIDEKIEESSNGIVATAAEKDSKPILKVTDNSRENNITSLYDDTEPYNDYFTKDEKDAGRAIVEGQSQKGEKENKKEKEKEKETEKKDKDAIERKDASSTEPIFNEISKDKVKEKNSTMLGVFLTTVIKTWKHFWANGSNKNKTHHEAANEIREMHTEPPYTGNGRGAGNPVHSETNLNPKKSDGNHDGFIDALQEIQNKHEITSAEESTDDTEEREQGSSNGREGIVPVNTEDKEEDDYWEGKNEDFWNKENDGSVEYWEKWDENVDSLWDDDYPEYDDYESSEIPDYIDYFSTKSKNSKGDANDENNLDAGVTELDKPEIIESEDFGHAVASDYNEKSVDVDDTEGSEEYPFAPGVKGLMPETERPISSSGNTIDGDGSYGHTPETAGDDVGDDLSKIDEDTIFDEDSSEDSYLDYINGVKNNEENGDFVYDSSDPAEEDSKKSVYDDLEAIHTKPESFDPTYEDHEFVEKDKKTARPHYDYSDPEDKGSGIPAFDYSEIEEKESSQPTFDYTEVDKDTKESGVHLYEDFQPEEKEKDFLAYDYTDNDEGDIDNKDMNLGLDPTDSKDNVNVYPDIEDEKKEQEDITIHGSGIGIFEDRDYFEKDKEYHSSSGSDDSESTDEGGVDSSSDSSSSGSQDKPSEKVDDDSEQGLLEGTDRGEYEEEVRDKEDDNTIGGQEGRDFPTETSQEGLADVVGDKKDTIDAVDNYTDSVNIEVTPMTDILETISPDDYDFPFDYDAYGPIDYKKDPEVYYGVDQVDKDDESPIKGQIPPGRPDDEGDNELPPGSPAPDSDGVPPDDTKHTSSPSAEVLGNNPGQEHDVVKLSQSEIETPEDPTVGAVMEETNPILWTWFIIAVMVAVTMICIVFFSMWVYSHRIARVAELRAALYEGYEPAKPEPVKEKSKDVDIEANKTDEVEDEMSANYQRNGAFGNRRSWYHVQLAAMMKRQETIQSVDSFASHDDDFAEYGDESMVGQTETLV